MKLKKMLDAAGGSARRRVGRQRRADGHDAVRGVHRVADQNCGYEQRQFERQQRRRQHQERKELVVFLNLINQPLIKLIAPLTAP